MFCLDISNGDGFDDDGYYNGFVVSDEDGRFGWEGMFFACSGYVGDVPNLSKWMVCGALVKSIISVDVSENFILGGIGGGSDGN